MLLLDHLDLTLKIGMVLLLLIIWVTITNKNNKVDNKRYNIFVVFSGTMFSFVTMTLIISIINGAPYKFIEMLFPILVVAFVYLLLLVLFQNWLREHCEATTCAGLWAMVSMLYLFCGSFMFGNGMIGLPLLMIPVPRMVLYVAGIVWGLGFIAYLSIAFYQHFKYKRYLKEGAKLVGEEDPRNQLLGEIKADYIHTKKPRLIVSDKAVSPVTIGVFRRDLILPDQDYEDDELMWIYRHEMTHLENQDNLTKVLMAFFSGAFWFLPLMSKACKQTAETIELGCDERVMRDCDEDTRRFYARLIIDSRGDTRGFTTCLSASGQSMKYRLSRIMHPRESKRLVNICVVAVAMLILFLGAGTCQISSTYGTASEIALGGANKPVELVMNSQDDSASISEEMLDELLNKKQAYQVNYEVLPPDDYRYFLVKADGQEYYISYTDHCMIVNKYWEEPGDEDGTYHAEASYYYIK